MSTSKQPQDFWKRLRPVALGLLVGGAGTVLLYGGTRVVFAMNNYISDSIKNNVVSPVPFNISQLPENTTTRVVEENSTISYPVNQFAGKLLVGPEVLSTFISNLFTISVGAFSTLVAIWGVGLVVLNANSNNRSNELKKDIEKVNENMKTIQGELKEDHKILSEKIDKLIENQKSTPITTSQF